MIECTLVCLPACSTFVSTHQCRGLCKLLQSFLFFSPLDSKSNWKQGRVGIWLGGLESELISVL